MGHVKNGYGPSIPRSLLKGREKTSVTRRIAAMNARLAGEVAPRVVSNACDAVAGIPAEPAHRDNRMAPIAGVTAAHVGKSRNGWSRTDTNANRKHGGSSTFAPPKTDELVGRDIATPNRVTAPHVMRQSLRKAVPSPEIAKEATRDDMRRAAYRETFNLCIATGEAFPPAR